MPAAIVRIALLFCLAQLLVSCAWLDVRTFSVPVDESSDLVGKRLSYLASWHEGQQQKQMLLVLEHQKSSVQLVGLSNTGITLFTLQRDENGDSLEKTFFYKGNPPAVQLLNQLMLAYYDAEFINKNLNPELVLSSKDNVRAWQYRSQRSGAVQFLEENAQQIILLSDNQNIIKLQLLATETLN